MRVLLRYLGGSRSQAGCAQEEFDVDQGATVAHIVREVERRHPALAPLLDRVRWAQNHEFLHPGERSVGGG